MKPYYEQDGITIYHGDCRDVIPTLGTIDLVVTDPPYNGVLADNWDNQWSSDSDFLSWLSGVSSMLADRLADNGTVYMFSSSRLAGRVEAVISERFRVIASAVWDKGRGGGTPGSGIDVTALRTYWPANTERVIVAEAGHNTAFKVADDKAKEQCGYWDKCKEARRSVFGDYLESEFKRAGVTNKQVAALFPSKTGRLTGCVSNWLMGANFPTIEQYVAMRGFLNGLGGDYLRRDYEDLRRDYKDLRRDYKDLRRDYEDLRRDYEDLRRPFNLTFQNQWGDVWRFPIERKREHPAQKPSALIQQMIRVSSRMSDVVLDPFMGSGTTLRAAKDLGRQAIGIELSEEYCEVAARRLIHEPRHPRQKSLGTKRVMGNVFDM